MNADSCNNLEFISAIFKLNCNKPVVCDGGTYTNPVKTT